MKAETILWRRLDRPGHEAARLYFDDASWLVEGSAVFAQEGVPCCLDYLIHLDDNWRTSYARVSGWVGVETIAAEITVNENRRWKMNGVDIPLAAGCIDLDLNFSPVTNTLPIRRLNLEIGETGEVHAAWLRFPQFTLEPLDQTYQRMGPNAYRYASGGGSFTADLAVNEAGLVTLYPDFWRGE